MKERQNVDFGVLWVKETCTSAWMRGIATKDIKERMSPKLRAFCRLFYGSKFLLCKQSSEGEARTDIVDMDGKKE